MPRARKLVLILFAGLAALYLAGLGLAFAAQRALIYPAPRARPPGWATPAGYREVALTTSDGLRLAALYRPAEQDLPTLVFFHGNGDNWRGGLAATAILAETGYGLLLPEYRGYSGNPGAPSEAGLYRDGEAALQFLATRRVAPNRTVLIGNSLGSGIATDLAARHQIAGLVLVSPFSSLPDAAAVHARLLPVRFLLRDRYDNLAKLPRVAAPILILHGADDRLIPPEQSERLAKAAPRARLVIVPGAGHELAYLSQSHSLIARWLLDL